MIWWKSGTWQYVAVSLFRPWVNKIIVNLLNELLNIEFFWIVSSSGHICLNFYSIDILQLRKKNSHSIHFKMTECFADELRQHTKICTSNVIRKLNNSEIKWFIIVLTSSRFLSIDIVSTYSQPLHITQWQYRSD